ncbi:DUF3999 domain-containing protein [Herbaspirillum camelliae]|uniref:DUF3999 domain-containing protein n=1 Tax=Herbaspirillum camelliae TaxID=1892903 RepID=UPI000949CCBE|nr:DUF3999 domain-containing protein [Herbaspirillum camelliae]
MKRLMMAVCTALVALVAQAGDAPPVSVAQWYALDLNGSGSYFRLSLPPEVYAASQRSDLGDVRIVNGAREPVPFSLEVTTVPAPARRVVLTPVSWFSVPAATKGGDKARLGVSLDADGTLRAEVGSRAGNQRKDDTVLVDLGREGTVDALRIRLRGEQYVGRVHVDASADLTQWQEVADAALVKAVTEGKRLVQDRVALDGVHQRYLRLSWPDGVPEIGAIEVETSVLEPVAETGAAPLLWRAAAQVQAGAQAGEYQFDTGGVYPVESLRIGLPQANTIAKVTLQSRADVKAPWRDVVRGSVFRLQGKSGEELSAPLRFNATPERHWRILVDMRTGGFGNGMPQVTLGWRPALLTFVARGSAPFMLGVGNATLVPVSQPRDDLLLGAQPQIGQASLGARLATPADQPAAAPTVSSRSIILWMALILAVAALAVIAWRLARSQPAGDKQA